MKKIILFLVLIALVASCKPTKEITTNTNIQNNTQTTEHVKKDSVYIYQLDSVYIYTKGDTVYVNRFKTFYMDRWQLKADSIYIYKTAYIDRKQTITKTIAIERKLSNWQKFIMWFGKISLLLISIAIAYYSIKYFSRFSKIYP